MDILGLLDRSGSNHAIKNESSPMSSHRRQFLNSVAGLAGAGLAGAGLAGTGLVGSRFIRVEVPAYASQEPIQTATSSHVQTGLAAYSFRSQFEFMRGKAQVPANDKKLDMFSFIDYCAQHNCGAELTSYFFPPTADEAYFLRVKRHAFLNGVPIVGTAIGNNFTIGKGEALDQQIADAKRWIDWASVMGAPHIRFFAGTRKQLEAAPDNMKIAIESLQSCADHAAKRGVFIGVENHGQLTADQVLQVVEGVQSDWFGVNLDTGNFVSEDPYADITRCVPHAVNIQFKIKMKTPEQQAYEADLPRIAKIIKGAKYRGYVVLEFEEQNPFEHCPGWLQKLHGIFG